MEQERQEREDIGLDEDTLYNLDQESNPDSLEKILTEKFGPSLGIRFIAVGELN